MDARDETSRGKAWRASVVVALLAAYVGMGVYFRAVLHTGAVYSHLAYVPVVLSSMWWGRRGLCVAVAVVAATLALYLVGCGADTLWPDVARAGFLVVAALVVGELSERVRAGTDALRASEAKYRWLIQESLAGVFTYRDDRVLFASDRLAEMLGYEAEELAGRSIWTLFHDDDRPVVARLVRERERGASPHLHYECRLVGKAGGVLWADMASSATTFQGEPAVLVTALDVTSRKKAEAKQRELSELARRQHEQLVHSSRLAELGEMAAAIAHELNQPLTGIRNFARNATFMIEQKAGTLEEVNDNLRLISVQVDRAAKIMNRVRELTRKSDRQFAPVDLNRVLRENVEFMMPQLQLSGVAVDLRLANGLPDVLGDRIRLEQVFLNLLTNAKQAMDEADVRRLHVESRLETGDGQHVVVEIGDTGRGFTKQAAGEMFKPFFTTKKVGQGTGLGLTISLSIVKEHQGTIRATGEPGKGACFTVRLPAADGKAKPRETSEDA